jgi:hypothetical protein
MEKLCHSFCAVESERVLERAEQAREDERAVFVG